MSKQDPVTSTPFTTHSLQMGETLKTKTHKFTDEENAMMTITGTPSKPHQHFPMPIWLACTTSHVCWRNPKVLFTQLPSF
jgi:hypothetical protein